MTISTSLTISALTPLDHRLGTQCPALCIPEMPRRVACGHDIVPCGPCRCFILREGSHELRRGVAYRLMGRRSFFSVEDVSERTGTHCPNYSKLPQRKPEQSPAMKNPTGREGRAWLVRGKAVSPFELIDSGGSKVSGRRY